MKLASSSPWQPSLTGQLVLVRPLKQQDFEELFKVASDPLIWEMHPESDRYLKANFQRFFDSAIASKGALAVFDRATLSLIGSSRFTAYSPQLASIEIGYTFLARTYWGKSYRNHPSEIRQN